MLGQRDQKGIGAGNPGQKVTRQLRDAAFGFAVGGIERHFEIIDVEHVNLRLGCDFGFEPFGRVAHEFGVD